MKPESLASLHTFREGAYQQFARRVDALFEMLDALLTLPSATAPAHRFIPTFDDHWLVGKNMVDSRSICIPAVPFMMTPFLPLPSGLTILAVEHENNTLTVHLRSESPTATSCPVCGCCSQRTHSRYWRTLADLPMCGQHVHLLVDVRRFFCDEPTCCRKLFVERLPDLTQPWSRKTNRLVETLQRIGFALTGAGGERFAQTLGMIVAPSTILRHLMHVPLPVTAPVEVVGLDDFSFRRGRTFGTIVVNLTTHQIIDLLPDRSATTVAQ